MCTWTARAVGGLVMNVHWFTSDRGTRSTEASRKHKALLHSEDGVLQDACTASSLFVLLCPLLAGGIRAWRDRLFLSRPVQRTI